MYLEYNFKEIELGIQNKYGKRWVERESSGAKFFCVSMFPYPSGNIHMGHVRNYTITDVIARYKIMKGFKVFQPFGWDAFGLPAENAALKNNSSPSQWTCQNINQMRNSIKRLGFAIDWSKELTTCDPEYYRFEQEFFLKMYARGLAYKKKAWVNWDPVDQTVLANEQVVNGRGWRSGALVERKEVEQWFLKITDYAEELLNDLELLKGWPQQVVAMQRNWIGKSRGVEIDFKLQGENSFLTVFTTRPDTIFGVSYLALAVDHPLAEKLAIHDSTLASFLTKCKQVKSAERDITIMEKLGIDTKLKAIHPFSGEEIPIWVANYVLTGYGTGVIMSVPAHDERDFAFAKKYDLPIRIVIRSNKLEKEEEEVFTESGVLFNSGKYDGLTSQEAFERIAQDLQILGIGRTKINYRLRDWGISRQRYWGTPIPIIECPNCGLVGATELPVVLPLVPLKDPHSPLKNLPDFYQTKCPKCGGEGKRETDTFDTFMESSWYCLKYASRTLDKSELKEWLPVDVYVGGIEHAVLHLLYARFIYKVLRDLGYIDGKEPFQYLITQGMVLKEGSKMSKSKGNIVTPEEIIERYGADTVRLFMIFMSPVDQALEWSQAGVEGSYRFIKRLYAFVLERKKVLGSFDLPTEGKALPDYVEIQSILSQINRDIEEFRLNTVVSGAMKLLNKLMESQEAILGYGVSILLRVLMPIIPHVTQYLWEELGWQEDYPWPQVDYEVLKKRLFSVVIQINGKLRGVIDVEPSISKETLEELVLKEAKIQKHLLNKKIKKVIVTPKLVNIVV